MENSSFTARPGSLPSSRFARPVVGFPAGGIALSQPPEIARGLGVSALLGQVRLTMPYLFDGQAGGLRVASDTPFLRTLLEASKHPTEDSDLSHEEYFRLCLSAHWATVASFFPVDVDGQIRFKLWSPTLPFETVESMAEVVLDAYRWDDGVVSNRSVRSPISGERIAAHHGEWFSVAVAAYGATRKRAPSLATRLREAIEFEVTREAKVYLEFRKAKDGLGLLGAATLIAHHLGDLDRVIDLWGIEAGDELHDFAYRAGYDEGSRAARFAGALSEAGRLNKAFMAAENHRHFALRAPKCLRRSPDFLLPLAPFFDSWGRAIATHPSLHPAEIGEIVEALEQGWEKLKGSEGITVTHAYARAVAGILEVLPGGMARLAELIPAKVERNLRSGLFHSLIFVPQARFEEQWALKALNFVRT